MNLSPTDSFDTSLFIFDELVSVLVTYRVGTGRPVILSVRNFADHDMLSDLTDNELDELIDQASQDAEMKRESWEETWRNSETEA